MEHCKISYLSYKNRKSKMHKEMGRIYKKVNTMLTIKRKEWELSKKHTD